MEYPGRNERTPGKYAETTLWDQAIEKYGGKDEKYKVQLKKQVMGYLGYANYVNRMNQVDSQESPMDLPSGPMTPAGAQAAYSSANANQLKELEYLRSIGKDIRGIGESISSSRLAEKKAKKGTSGEAEETSLLFKNLAAFDPMDETDAAVKDWMENATGPNGRYMDLEALRVQEVSRKMAMGVDRETAIKEVEETIDRRMPNDMKVPEDKVYKIKHTIKETGEEVVQDYTDPGVKSVLLRELKKAHPTANQHELDLMLEEQLPTELPENLQYRHHLLYYIGQGMTETQAKAEVDKDDYANNKMTPGKRSLYEQNHPSDVEEVKLYAAFPGLQKDLQPVKTEDGKTALPKTFSQLKLDYPQVEPTVLEKHARKAYTADASSDIDDWLETSESSTDADGKLVPQPAPKKVMEVVTTQKEAAENLASFEDAKSLTGYNVEFDNYMAYIAENNGMLTEAEVRKMAKEKLAAIGAYAVARAAIIRQTLKQQRPDAAPEEVEAEVKRLMKISE